MLGDSPVCSRLSTHSEPASGLARPMVGVTPSDVCRSRFGGDGTSVAGC